MLFHNFKIPSRGRVPKRTSTRAADAQLSQTPQLPPWTRRGHQWAEVPRTLWTKVANAVSWDAFRLTGYLLSQRSPSDIVCLSPASASLALGIDKRAAVTAFEELVRVGVIEQLYSNNSWRLLVDSWSKIKPRVANAQVTRKIPVLHCGIQSYTSGGGK